MTAEDDAIRLAKELKRVIQERDALAYDELTKAIDDVASLKADDTHPDAVCAGATRSDVYLRALQRLRCVAKTLLKTST